MGKAGDNVGKTSGAGKLVSVTIVFPFNRGSLVCLIFRVLSSRSHAQTIHSTVMGKNRWEFITDSKNLTSSSREYHSVGPEFVQLTEWSVGGQGASCPRPWKQPDNKTS